jgi:hypothetical protein
MKVLIACEFSGIVREAFKSKGHNAWSCDLLPTDIPGNHLIGDVRKYIFNDWDMMIAHPPCTYLCNSGVRWLKSNPVRWEQMLDGAQFFKTLWSMRELPISKICIENPIPHKHASLPKYSQIIQPWQFGHGEIKATCLWLSGLPLLQPTSIVNGRTPRVHHASPGPDRWKERSRTYQGIANAMAEQWT